MPIQDEKVLESKLPYGKELTNFLVQSYISDSNVSKLLQRKGVFFGIRDKTFTVPLAASMLLTPEEFEYIKDKRNSKEDSLKRRTTAHEWSSDKTLSEEISLELDVHKIIDTEFKGYEVNGAPTFVIDPDNKNSAKMDFEITRVDHTKNWCNSEKNFRGSIELEVADGAFEISMIKYNTSPETEEVCNKVLAYVKKELKAKGCISSKSFDVFFSAFDNAQRVDFFGS